MVDEISKPNVSQSNPVVYKVGDIDDLYLAVSKITTHAYNKNKSTNARCLSTATGFFYVNGSSNYFLVTNRHVIIDENAGLYPNILRLYLHTDEDDLTKNDNFDIPLYNGVKKRWLEPKGEMYDVVAIPIEKNFLNRGCLTCFSDDHFFPEEYRLSLGQEVLVFGYPLGFWHDHKHNLPVIRSGTVASAYPIPYNQNPYFLVDSRLHKGTSGAPVITRSPTRLYKNVQVARDKKRWGRSDEEIKQDKLRNQRFLLGINAATFPFPKSKQSSDLNAVYFAHVLRIITT